MLDEIIVKMRHPQIPSHLDPKPVSRARGAIVASSRYVLAAVARGSRARLEKTMTVLLLKYLKGYGQLETIIRRKYRKSLDLLKFLQHVGSNDTKFIFCQAESSVSCHRSFDLHILDLISLEVMHRQRRNIPTIIIKMQ